MNSITSLLSNIHKLSQAANDAVFNTYLDNNPAKENRSILPNAQKLEFNMLVANKESSLLEEGSFFRRTFIFIGTWTLPKTTKPTPEEIKMTLDSLKNPNNFPNEASFSSTNNYKTFIKERERLCITFNENEETSRMYLLSGTAAICAENNLNNRFARGIYTTAIGVSALALSSGAYFYSRKQ